MDNLEQEGQDPSSRPSTGSSLSRSSPGAIEGPAAADSDPADSVVTRFKQRDRPKVYSPDQQGVIREEGTGARDFNAQFFEFAQRRERIEKLQKENKRLEASTLLDNEYVDSLNQEVMADIRGNDPLYDQGNTIAMTEETKAIRTQRLIGERMGHLDRAVQENAEDVGWLTDLWSSSVTQFRELNKATLAELHSLTPEQAAERIKPLQLLESEAGNIQGRIAKLNARFKQIDPNFSVFSHPATAMAAQGLGVLANTERPSIFAKNPDPLSGFLGPTLTGITTTALGAAEGAAQFMLDLTRPIGSAGGLVGDWVLRSILSEDGYNAAQQKIFETTGFHPDFVGAPNIELRDEHGDVHVVKNRFGLPELVGPVGALIYGQNAAEFANNAREAKEIWRAYQDGGWGWGLAHDVSNFVGGLAGLGVATKPFMMAAAQGKTFVARGMAAVGAKTGTTASKIANVLGNGAAQAAGFGAYELISHGFMEGYTDSFARGAETGLVFWALGALGKQTESLLLRKEMPMFLSNMLGAATEGVGMTAYGVGRELAFRDTPAGKALWHFLRDPSHESWHGYQEELSKNVLGMVAFKAAFGRQATRENLLAQRLQKEALQGRKTLEEAGRRQAGERTAQMLVDLKEGRTDAPMESFYLARYAKEVAPLAKQIGQQGREEQALGQSRGEPEQMLPGSLSGRTGTFHVEATENLAERMIRMNRRRDAARAEAGGGEGRELGIVGTHIGDRLVFSATKGVSTPAGPAVEIGQAAEKLRREFRQKESQELDTERIFTMHNHPGSTAFSGQDLGYFLGARAGTGADKHVVTTDRGVWVAQAHKALPADAKIDVGAINTQIHAARGRPTAALLKALGAKDAKELQERFGLSPREAETILASGKALSNFDVTKAFEENWRLMKSSTPAQRALAKASERIYAEAVSEVAAKNGIEIKFFDAQEGTRRFGEFQKTGDFQKAFNTLAPSPPSVAAERLRRDMGQAGEALLGEPSPERLEALARAYKTYRAVKQAKGEVPFSYSDAKQEPSEAAFMEVAREQLGVEGLAATPANVERLMRAAGIETGGPAASGAPDRASFTRVEIPDAELLKVTRSDAELEVRARAMEREGAFSKSLGRLYDAESYQRIAEGLRAMKATGRLAEPGYELPGMLRETTGGKQPSAPPPSDKDAETFLKEMLGRPSKLLEQQKSVFQRIKGWGARFAAAFKNPSTRDLLAKSIEQAGYLSKFKKLGADREFVVAETDRLQVDLRLAPRLAMGDLKDVFDPITRKEGVTPEQRIEELRDVQAYAVLRDQFDNRIRTRDELIVDDAGKPVLDAAGNRQFRKVETENLLPGNLTPEQWQRALLAAEEKLTPEGRQAYQNMRNKLDEAWQSLVDRGLARAEDKQKNYYPRKVVDYEDFIAGIGPMRDITPPREPFRGFLKARAGSERMIDPTPEALMSYLAKVRLTNAIHDYNERVATGIENRLFDALGVSAEDVKNMTAQEWRDLRERAEKEHGGVVVDLRYGRSGQETIERDPITLDTIAAIHAATGMRIIPEAVVGRNLRPDAELGRHLVTKEMVDLWREQRAASSWLQSPLLRGIRRMVGRWFKGPALRGLGGARVFGRNVRNVISDETAVLFKDSARAALETTKLLPESSPIAKALAVRDSEAAIARLSPTAQSLARELQRYGTSKTGIWTSEVEGMRDQLEGEWLKRYVPETRQFLKWTSKLARGDFQWANAVDNYAENLVRIAYFMRERMSALRDDALDVRPGETAEVAATRAAHLKVNDVLVNYDHLTPLERVALNGLLFPFYTWARYNFTKQLAEAIRHPGNTLGKYATYAGVIGLANWLLAPDEESRLAQLRPELAGRGHLFLPWMRDEFGNPLLLTWEDTFTAAADFLGLSGVGTKLGSYVLGHGNEDLLMAQLFPQGLDHAQRTFANATAPWVRQALDVGYRTSYQTVGERGESIERTVQRAFLPATDAARYLGAAQKDESLGARALTQVPMLRFLDLSDAVPLSQAGQQFEAGRIQRAAAQTSLGLQHYLKRFTAGLRSGDADQMQKAVDGVWADVGDQMTQSGQSEAHLWARMLKLASRELLMQEMSAGSGSLPPKFWQLTRTQQSEFLMRLGK